MAKILRRSKPLFLVAISVLYLRHWVPALQYGPEQMAVITQAEQLVRGNFPATGLINSSGFKNPNALVFTIAPAVLLSTDPETTSFLVGLWTLATIWISIRVAVLQTLGTGHCTTILLISACTVFSPLFAHTACDIWGQHVARTLLCLLTALLLSISNLSAIKYRRTSLILVGFLLAWLPAVHLATAALLPGIGGFLLYSVRRLKDWRMIAAGTCLATMLTWYPWYIQLPTMSSPHNETRHILPMLCSLLHNASLSEAGIAIRAYHEGANLNPPLSSTITTDEMLAIRASGIVRWCLSVVSLLALASQAFARPQANLCCVLLITAIFSGFLAVSALGYRSRLDYYIVMVPALQIALMAHGGRLLQTFLSAPFPMISHDSIRITSSITLLLLIGFQLVSGHTVRTQYLSIESHNIPTMLGWSECADCIKREVPAEETICLYSKDDSLRWLFDMYRGEDAKIISQWGVLRNKLANEHFNLIETPEATFKSAAAVVVIGEIDQPPDPSVFRKTGATSPHLFLRREQVPSRPAF